jgi:hypothetical protein
LDDDEARNPMPEEAVEHLDGRPGEEVGVH